MTRMLLLLLLLLLVAFISTIESRNDVTTLQFYICDGVTVSPTDPYIRNVNSLINDLVMGVPVASNQEMHMVCQYQQTIAFGYAYCEEDDITYQDCFECLAAASALLYRICGPAIGAQIGMAVCYIRYENYRFM